MSLMLTTIGANLFNYRKSYWPMWRLLLLGQILDAVTFVTFNIVHPDNGLVERNPIVLFIVTGVGIYGFAAIKILLPLRTGYLFRSKKNFSWKYYFFLSLIAATGFVGFIFNTRAILS